MSKSFQVEINHHKATVKKLDKQRKKVVSITQSSSNSQLDKVGWAKKKKLEIKYDIYQC